MVLGSATEISVDRFLVVWCSSPGKVLYSVRIRKGRGKASGVTVNTDCKHPRKSGKEAALSRKLSYLVRTVILVTVRTDFREGDVIAVAGVRK